MNRDQANEVEGWDEMRQQSIHSICNVVCTLAAGKRTYFLNLMKNCFEPFIKSGKEDNKFDWKRVKIFYNASKSYLKNLCLLKLFCSYVFKLFFLFECQDVEFILKMIHIYHQVLKECKTLDLCYNCIQMKHPKHYVEENLCLESILKSINKVENTYVFTNRELYSRLTIDAIYEGDYDFLQFLVKYGLSYLPDDVLNQVRIELQLIHRRIRLLKRLRDMDEVGERNTFEEHILEQLLTDTATINFKRILLTAMAANIILCKINGDIYYPDYVKCLNMYLLTVSDAPISQRDAEYFLDFALKNDNIIQTEIYSNFLELFPDAPRMSSPRSLKHLCRCKVRDCIEKSPSLITVLSQIQIPSAVKDCLLFS